MLKALFKATVFTCFSLLIIISEAFVPKDQTEQYRRIAMRTIGHQLLLYSSDSTSNILPIEKEENRYKIQFEHDFQFLPLNLVASVDSVMRQANIADNYIVEVENCKNEEIVYSYGINNLIKSPIIPCLNREQDKGCYIIYVTIPGISTVNSPNETSQAQPSYLAWWLIGLLIPIGLLINYRKKKQQANSNIINIGAYRFDQLNSELLLENQKQELSSKEAGLLLLLYKFANTTLNREVILQKVWGDEGDYVGRTLDVFISKLRKRLELDARVKIVNIRGIGYKMVLNKG